MSKINGSVGVWRYGRYAHTSTLPHTHTRLAIFAALALVTAGCAKKEPIEVPPSQAPSGAVSGTGAQAQSAKPNFNPGPGSDL